MGIPGAIYFKSLVPISNRGAVAPHIISARTPHEDNIPTARKKLLLRQTTTIWANMGLKCNFHCVRIKKKDQMVLPPPGSPFLQKPLSGERFKLCTLNGVFGFGDTQIAYILIADCLFPKSCCCCGFCFPMYMFMRIQFR